MLSIYRTSTAREEDRVYAFLFSRLLPGRRGPRVEVRGRVASAGAGGRQDKQTSAFAPLLLLSAPGSSAPQAAAACVSVSHDFRRPYSPGTSDIGDRVVGGSGSSRRRVGPRRSILVDRNRRSVKVSQNNEKCSVTRSQSEINSRASRSR